MFPKRTEHFFRVRDAFQHSNSSKDVKLPISYIPKG